MFFIKNSYSRILGIPTYLFLLTILSCQKSKEKDTEVHQPAPTEETSQSTTIVAWNNSSFLDPLGKRVNLNDSELKNGGPSLPLELTHTQANYPLALFQGGSKEDAGVAVSPVPFLAFKVEDKSRITIRHIKGVNGQNISSEVITPVLCPDVFLKYVDKAVPASASGVVDSSVSMAIYCIPLINAVVPGILVPTDNSGSYVHEFIVSVKSANKIASVLSSKIATRIIIPNSVLSIKISNELSKLKLSDRLTIATNDLVGSPRRDFQAFQILGDVAPGVQTSWVLNFSNVQMTMEEEVFFEQAVVPGSTPAKPEVSRGGSFFKRKSVISSLDHFKLRVINGANAQDIFSLSSGDAASKIEMKILDGNAPLQIFLIPDFGSPSATKSMGEYVKPFSPTFCPREQSAFKPEEWRQSKSNPYYTACEATTRTRLVDITDSVSKGVTNPLETFFGAFSYMPRMGQTVLGGTNGILSLRISLTGTLTVAVRNPHNLETTTTIGSLPLAYSYQFPTALDEIELILKNGKGAPGMDTILSAMQRKGIQELPKRSSTLPAFPFMGLERFDYFY